MKVFVIARDKTGLRTVNAFLEHEGEDADRAERVAKEHFNFRVYRVLGADMRDVVLSHPALFGEAG